MNCPCCGAGQDPTLFLFSQPSLLFLLSLLLSLPFLFNSLNAYSPFHFVVRLLTLHVLLQDEPKTKGWSWSGTAFCIRIFMVAFIHSPFSPCSPFQTNMLIPQVCWVSMVGCSPHSLAPQTTATPYHADVITTIGLTGIILSYSRAYLLSLSW